MVALAAEKVPRVVVACSPGSVVQTRVWIAEDVVMVVAPSRVVRVVPGLAHAPRKRGQNLAGQATRPLVVSADSRAVDYWPRMMVVVCSSRLPAGTAPVLNLEAIVSIAVDYRTVTHQAVVEPYVISPRVWCFCL